MIDFTYSDFYIGFAIIVFSFIISAFYNYIVIFNITHEQKQESLKNKDHILFEAKTLIGKYGLSSSFKRENLSFVLPYNLKKSIVKFNADVFLNTNIYNSVNSIYTTFMFIDDKISKSNSVYKFNKIFSFTNLFIWIIEVTFLAMSWWELGLIILLTRLLLIVVKFIINLPKINKNIDISFKYLKTDNKEIDAKILKILKLKRWLIFDELLNHYSKTIFELAISFKKWGRDE
ncbi:hypothetical protein [Mycoplasma elephantis]|uniref:hypothetical protein n=1 Tax=Mycoplasma elephantis TaxID=114882 RepID=UPI00048986DC|nr:hypothetical protein [Mycoplasma elephantis]